MHNCFYIMLDLAYSSYFFGRHKILDLARSDWLFKKAEANKSKMNKNKFKDEKKKKQNKNQTKKEEGEKTTAENGQSPISSYSSPL